MAENTYKNTFKTSNKKEEQKEGKRFSFKFEFVQDKRFQLVSGFFLIILSIYFLTAFVSYLFTGKSDQSVVEAINQTGWIQSGLEADNWLGAYGAMISHYFIFQWFGLGAFLIPPFLFVLGYRVVFQKALVPTAAAFGFVLFFVLWLSLLFGYIIFHKEGPTEWSFLGGGLGYYLARLFDSLIGWGTFLLLIFSLLAFIVYFFNITTLLGFNKNEENAKANSDGLIPEELEEDNDGLFEEEEDDELGEDKESELDAWTVTTKDEADEVIEDELNLETEEVLRPETEKPIDKTPSLELDVEIPESAIEEVPEPEFTVEDAFSDVKKVENQENYDPTLDLGTYQYPTINLLNQYDSGQIQVSKEELEENKDKIIKTLVNFKIGISSIKATIGPTVTLYEIVPEAGIKISKIKNLEDDIALSLAALGIRIIAPIPGKGTIGIEVPNKNREMVDMRSVLSTEKFMKSDKDLPVVLGKTISNEIFVIDLAKMPHLLMAGATGQGKSVGINVLLTSLLYKKHPSQLKFVLIDPKKVELSIFNKIERHFLAMLPDGEEAIITDTKKVVNTLNSLCIEMDNRYDLLKDAGTRNLKEYNQKFVKRRLNPEKGHRFMPFIVLVIDELADLMMTAGKEVETPIARLAQLARAIGIHLVVATQRPSVNVITGTIKANFPARLSFRVTSKIDSRTILDAGGADQLVGMGDMLFSQGSDVIRLQCAFVDTPEVENICDFIGEQRGYETAYMLPEFVGDDEGGSKSDIDLSDRDAMFEEAARVIVMHQQGSTSLIQRKLKLGYNRAGRIIDQLEAAGIVGPFGGSKARDVLIPDEYSLEQLLNELNN